MSYTPRYILVLLISLTSCIKNQDVQLFSLLDKKQTGLVFENHLPVNVMNNDNVLSSQYYYNGAGVAIGDINNDGLTDIYLTANKSSNRLFLNLGDLKFKDITNQAGVGSDRFSTGATFVDINNDGYLDLYVCNGGVQNTPSELANQFYINQQDGTFKEMARKYGVNDPNYSTHATFFDYDRDGDLDLYVLNYSTDFRGDITKRGDMTNKELKKVSGRMLENQSGNRFKDVTEESGLLHYGYGLGVVASDIDGDGWTDLYIANDFTIPDKLYINNKNKTFQDQIKNFTNQVSWFSMGLDIADINNDGLLDIGVLDMAADDHIRGKVLMASMDPRNFNYLVDNLNYQHQYMFNTLQINNGNNTFSNIANLSGVAKTDWSWAPLFADFNNDGYKDYFVSNGFRKAFGDNDFRIKLNKAKKGKLDQETREKLYDEMPEIKLQNKLFMNTGDLKFKDTASEEGLDQLTFSNGAAYADLDNDGDLDLVVNNIDQPVFLYRNNSDKNKNNKFLRINLESVNSADYYNTRVTIFYNNKLQLQEYSPARGFQSCVEHVLHFGIEQEAELIDSVVVDWFDDYRQVIVNVPPNQVISINKSNAQPYIVDNSSDSMSLYSTLPASVYGIDFKHIENDYDDFVKESLLPHRQSCLGPFASVADVDNDGLEDVFIGGASQQAGKLYLQKKNGIFVEHQTKLFESDILSEDMGSLFLDFDNDNDMDLYVVSGGGGEFDKKSPHLQDRLYVNLGDGSFIKSENILPNLTFSGQQVKAEDVDGDGDLDLFVGGRTLPGLYPYSPRSVLLINQEGIYVDKTEQWNPKLKQLGMVTDFIFSDINNDSKKDLIIVGEWETIKVFINKGDHFIDMSKDFSFGTLSGWWYSIESGDFNNDNIVDYVIGNIGENIKFKASEKEPFHIFTNDFDNSGDQDIVLSYYYNGELVPSRGRECSSGDMPFITSKCKTYKEFAESSLEDVYGSEKLESANHLIANIFSSIIVLSNSDGGYDYKKLNIEAQFSAINKIIVNDFNVDGNLDILVGGNMYHTEVETPRYDAGTGVCLYGDGTGNFNALSVLQSGIYIDNDVKDIEPIVINNQSAFLVTNNNNEPQIIIENK